MIGHQLVVLSDAHLGDPRAPHEDRLLEFLERVPDLGDVLLINGDLFDFWFSYRTVVPRRGFRVAAALTVLRRRLPILMTGGNHDRWGGTFWAEEAGIAFYPQGVTFQAANRRIRAEHGDGITEHHRSARVLHRLTRHRSIIGAFRLLHPDVGHWLVHRMSPRIAEATRDDQVLEQAARSQCTWAQNTLASNRQIDLLVLGHTHRSHLESFDTGQHFLNPGAWMDGLSLAIVSSSAITLTRFGSEIPHRVPPVPPQPGADR